MVSVFCFSDIPVIPDLDEVQEEDLTMQIAAPPRYSSELLEVHPYHSGFIHTLARRVLTQTRV